MDFQSALESYGKILNCFSLAIYLRFYRPRKALVKLIKRVQIAYSFLQSVSDQFHVIILSLPIKFYKWLSKNVSKPTSKNGDTDHFNL